MTRFSTPTLTSANTPLTADVPGKIRGQEVELVVSEGINHDNQAYREVSAMFQGRGGQAVVLVSGPAASWDQGMVDEFIASIR